MTVSRRLFGLAAAAAAFVAGAARATPSPLPEVEHVPLAVPPVEVAPSPAELMFPRGIVMMHVSGSPIPEGWALCDAIPAPAYANDIMAHSHNISAPPSHSHDITLAPALSFQPLDYIIKL
jgi:hypothetical protein